MTTDELLWNATFEQECENSNNPYNYAEEWAMERYYEDKELFERFGDYLNAAS